MRWSVSRATTWRNFAPRAANRWITWRSARSSPPPPNSIRIRIEFGGGGDDRAERHVIHRFAARGAKLRHVVARETDHRIAAHQLARIPRRQIVLAHVQPGFQQQREIGAVVDYQRGPGFAAEARHGARGSEETAAPLPLMADLENAGTAIQKSRCGGFQQDSAGVERFRIENRVDPGKPH